MFVSKFLRRLFKTFPLIAVSSLAAVPLCAQNTPMSIGTVGGQLNLDNPNSYQPFSDYLNRNVPGYEFEVTVFDTIRDLIEAVEDNSVQFAMVTPAAYVELAHGHDIRTIATVTQEVDGHVYPWLAGAVFTLDSNAEIRTLEDAKGHSVIALSRLALGGWLSALREWRLLGIDEEKDFTSLDFVFSYQEVIDKVCRGETDIGVAIAGVLHNRRHSCDRPLRVLTNAALEPDPRYPLETSTRLYPEVAFVVVGKNVEESLIINMAQALLQLEPGSREARAATVAGFTAPLSYSSVIDLMLELRLGPYEGIGKFTLTDLLSQHGGKLFLLLSVFLSLMTVAMLRSQFLYNQLERADRFRKLLFEKSNLPTVVLDSKKLTFVDLNQSALDIYGYKSADELVGKTPEVVSAPFQKNGNSSAEEIVLLYEKLQTGQRIQFEWLHQRPDGSQWEAEVYAVSLKSDKLSMLQATLLDVTERNRTRDEKEKIEHQLRHSQRLESLGRLSGAVAHDFNNLLSVINGYSELILMKKNNDEDFYKYVQEIARAGWQARELTTQLLTFGRRQITRVQPVNVNTHIVETLSMYRSVLGENIDLQIELQPELELISIDSGQLSQVFLNVLVNAKDAMPQGGSSVIATSKVVISPSEATLLEVTVGEYVLVTISDTGQGMTEEVKEHIFEPFFSTKGEKGSGIGLATVYGILRQCGGSISFTSAINQGTTFYIYFPVLEIDERAIENSSKNVVQDLDATKPFKVLVVEDQEEVRLYASAVLRSAGYQVLEAQSGEQALDVAERNNGEIDLLFTDVVMTGMNGRELSELFEKRWPKIKILFTSGYADDQVALHGVSQDIIQFISKPYMPQYLLKKLREILNG